MARGRFGSSGAPARAHAERPVVARAGPSRAALSSSAIRSSTTAITAASNSPAPPRITMPSVNCKLHEFDQGTSEVPGMDEGDPCPPASRTRTRVDQSRSLCLEVLEREIDRGDGECDMVQPLAMTLEEATHRCVRSERLEKLDEGPANGDHRLLDPLALDALPVQRLHPISPPVSVESGVEVVNCDCGVIEVDQFHEMRLFAHGEDVIRAVTIPLDPR